MNKALLSILCVFISFLAYSQSTSVQTFTYESTTRDTVISFPDGDHNNYERIIMYYSMRCKDALVSTGSDRNRGCGEWDYSCNTYIEDSTRVDSVKASSPEYAMPGYDADIFSYTNSNTYDFYQAIHKKVSINDILKEDVYSFSASANADSNEFYTGGQGKLIYFMIDADWMADEGLDRINAFNWDSGSNASFKNLIINMAETQDTSIDDALSNGGLDWVNYFISDISVSDYAGRIPFHDDYRWDDASNLIVAMSYDQLNVNLESLMTDSVDPSKILVYNNDNSRYMRCGSSGKIRIAEGLEELSDAVTIAFWQKGSDRLPVNSTIIEGVDDQNRRQINIHLPWGNSQVYWDCGNDGGAYDRINKTAQAEDFRGQWNHWAFTKDATTGIMEIYLNGEMWHSGTGKTHSIDLRDLSIGGNHVSSLYYYGDMDDLSIWNRALDATEIQNLMYRSGIVAMEQTDDLLLFYNFNSASMDSEPTDLSRYKRTSEQEGRLVYPKMKSAELLADATNHASLPALSLINGVYLSSDSDSIVIDSVPVLPQRIDHYGLDGTDLSLQWTDYFYQAGSYPVYDSEGNVVDEVNYPADGEYEKGELIYYNKTPMRYEIISFVTPYGIGIDFGEEGLTWTFDVTDFGPILKGDKRIFLSRGGQWQEDMDIRFEFIEGIPDRDVIDIQQIWSVDQIPYGNILNDWRFEPVTFTYDPSVSRYVIKTAITGHGQEGEFIPRNHSINVGGFIDSWSVWKECAENPVYPQGGTWVYDRAGWCPGMATDVREFDVTEYFQFLQEAEVDYTVQTASGDSRYIVNSQLIKYGAPNKMHDAAIVDMINPSQKIEHGRFNPSCHAPELILKNRGSETLREATIYYGIRGKTEKSYAWQGSLPFLIETSITLPYDPQLAVAEDGDIFYARVELNAGTDENTSNNEYETEIVMADHYDGPFVIEWLTNFTPQETSYRVEDEAGNVLLQKLGGGLNRNAIYRDTLFDLNGCYRLYISDTDNDGISWWANNDGNGYIRVKQEGGSWKEVATDFGAFIQYDFTVGSISSSEDLYFDEAVYSYPNPATEEVFVTGLASWNEKLMLHINDELGRLIFSGQINRSGQNTLNLTEYTAGQSGMLFISIRDDKNYSSLRHLLID